MEEIQWLVEELRKRFPNLIANIDEPENPNGNYWLNAKVNEKLVIIEWVPQHGFGFFADDAGYGEKPAEFVLTKEAALEKVIGLLLP